MSVRVGERGVGRRGLEGVWNGLRRCVDDISFGQELLHHGLLPVATSYNRHRHNKDNVRPRAYLQWPIQRYNDTTKQETHHILYMDMI